MSRCLATIQISVLALLLPAFAWGACVTVDVSSLNATQRGKLTAAAVQIQPDAVVRWQDGSAQPVSLQSQASQVSICANSTTGVTLSALQANITTILTAQATEDTAIAAQVALVNAAKTEIGSNNLCTQATLAAIDAVVDANKVSIQTDIDNTTTLLLAKTALTTMNNTYAAAFKKVARCLLARTQAAN